MRTVWPVLTIILAAAAGSTTTGTRTNAATRATEDLSDLLRMADAVAEVSVVATRVEAPESALPRTVATLKVLKVHKGSLANGAEVSAEYVGGTIGDRQVISSGQPRLAAGDRAVLLLTKRPNAAHWRVLGGDVGQIVLTTDGQGRTAASRAEGLFEYFVPDARESKGYRHARSETLPVDAMEELVGAVLREGTPVVAREEIAGTAPVTDAAGHGCTHVPAVVLAPRPAEPSSDSPFVVRLLSTMGLITAFWVVSRRVLRKLAMA
jgi:hypothetical protein